TNIPAYAKFCPWVIQRVCGGTSRSWRNDGWKGPGCCAKDSASPRWRASWVCTGNRAVAGRGSLSTAECTACPTPTPGRPPKLTQGQMRDIEGALKRGPEGLGYSSGLWTARRVRELIKQQTGVRYHEDHVWRILRKLGWSCQRPTGRALERNEQAIKRWKQ